MRGEIAVSRPTTMTNIHAIHVTAFKLQARRARAAAVTMHLQYGQENISISPTSSSCNRAGDYSARRHDDEDQSQGKRQYVIPCRRAGCIFCDDSDARKKDGKTDGTEGKNVKPRCALPCNM